MARGNRFSVYDTRAFTEIFESNPANPFSRSPVDQSPLYKGPMEFPKMLYHPDGEERIVVPAVWETDKSGQNGKWVGEQRELIHMTVASPAEEKEALTSGWHDHPAKAIRARITAQIEANPKMGEKDRAKLLAAVPMISSENRIKDLEAELARLQGLKETQDENEAA